MTRVASSGLLPVLQRATRKLSKVTDSPEAEAEILLRHVLACSRAELYAGNVALTPELQQVFESMIERRVSLEPLQYITGSQTFRKLEIRVGPGVFVPRPETELVVDHALAKIRRIPKPVVIEVGTGSGAIAIAIATERPSATVYATEVSDRAMPWAAKNNAAHGGRVHLLSGSLFEPLPEHLVGVADLVISNPPYLSEEETEHLPADVANEPRSALVSGPTGLELPSAILREAPHWLKRGGWLLMETSPTSAARLRRLMRDVYRPVQILDDLAGNARIAIGRTPWHE